jgi:hypothetical protein
MEIVTDSGKKAPKRVVMAGLMLSRMDATPLVLDDGAGGYPG